MAEKTFANGFEDFRGAVLRAAQPIVDEIQTDKDYLEIFENAFFDRSGTRHFNRTLSQQDQVFNKIWRGYVEIERSFEALNDFATYITVMPPKKAPVSKSRFLRYQIGNYLNEVYILKERLETYYKVVIRIYRNAPRLLAIKRRIEGVSKLLSFTFDEVVAIRGNHVHKARYNDIDLDRLDLLELILQNKKTSSVRALYSSAIRETQKKWIELSVNYNKKIAGFLDVYFGVLHQIIFDDQNEWLSPISLNRHH